MQIFKLYFKILNKNITTMIMYIAIFMAVVFGVLVPAKAVDNTASYTEQKCTFGVEDRDKSILSQKLINSLENSHKKAEIQSVDKEYIQDELYARNLHAVVIIEKGFEESLTAGDTEKYLKIYDVPSNNAAKLFTSDVNEFLRYSAAYKSAGYSMEEAAGKAADLCKVTEDVELTGNDGAKETKTTVFFQYMGYIMVVLIGCVVTNVLIVFNKKDVRDRIESSSFEFAKYNSQILLGTLIVGIALVAIFCGFAMTQFGGELSGIRLVLFIVNALCLTLYSMAFAFLISRATSNQMVINMVANIVALGMAFLCGVFVPKYLLSDAVLGIARFLPTYWYVDAVGNIDLYTPDKLGSILLAMGIQVLFAIALIIIGLVVARNKKQAV